jgi:hypothetical protein
VFEVQRQAATASAGSGAAAGRAPVDHLSRGHDPRIVGDAERSPNLGDDGSLSGG